MDLPVLLSVLQAGTICMAAVVEIVQQEKFSGTTRLWDMVEEITLVRRKIRPLTATWGWILQIDEREARDCLMISEVFGMDHHQKYGGCAPWLEENGIHSVFVSIYCLTPLLPSTAEAPRDLIVGHEHELRCKHWTVAWMHRTIFWQILWHL